MERLKERIEFEYKHFYGTWLTLILLIGTYFLMWPFVLNLIFLPPLFIWYLHAGLYRDAWRLNTRRFAWNVDPGR